MRDHKTGIAKSAMKPRNSKIPSIIRRWLLRGNHAQNCGHSTPDYGCVNLILRMTSSVGRWATRRDYGFQSGCEVNA